LKKHNFFYGNIKYIYERASNLTLKRYYVILLSEVFKPKDFLSRIEKI